MMWLAAFVAAACAAAATAAFRRWAPPALVDAGSTCANPSTRPVRGGGLGVLAGVGAGVTSAWLLGLPLDRRVVMTAAAAVAPIAAISFADDLRERGIAVRLAVHCLAAVAAVALLGPALPAGLASHPSVGAALSVVGLTAAVNVYNFMDGSDGLLASSAAIQLGFLAAWTGDATWGAAAGATAGFLAWNWPPARVYLGDVGSTSIGALVGLAALASWRAQGVELFAVVLPVVADATYTLGRRAVRCENLLRRHTSHVYQRLLRGGASPPAVAAGYALLTAVFGGLAWCRGIHGLVAALAITVVSIGAAEWTLAARGVPFAARRGAA